MESKIGEEYMQLEEDLQKAQQQQANGSVISNLKQKLIQKEINAYIAGDMTNELDVRNQEKKNVTR